jgi:hypothetical protein
MVSQAGLVATATNDAIFNEDTLGLNISFLPASPVI